MKKKNTTNYDDLIVGVGAILFLLIGLIGFGIHECIIPLGFIVLIVIFGSIKNHIDNEKEKAYQRGKMENEKKGNSNLFK